MRIDYKELENKKLKNKFNKEFLILEYIGKDKNNHMYKIEFSETKNLQLATRQQITKGTVKDLLQEKKLKQLRTQEKLKERTRLVKQTKNKLVIPRDIREKTILSVDLATYKTGITYYRESRSKSKLIEAQGNLLERTA